MQTKFKFTTSALKSLPPNPPESKSTELEFSDTEITGFKCLSGKTGSKRFLLRYSFNGRRTSIAIGRFPDLSLKVARDVARQHKAQLAMGIDPKAKRDESTNQSQMPDIKTFFRDCYLPLMKKRKITWKDDIARFELCKAIHNVRYDQLTVQQVFEIQLDLVSDTPEHYPYAPATCNRAIALLKTMGKMAEDYLGIINVAMKVALLPENNARTRYCTVSETKSIIHEALKYPCRSSGAYIALLFLTGCRATELRLRTWDELDLEQGTLRIPKTKNGTQHVIYLSDYMMEIFDSIPRVTNNPYIFAGNKLGKPINRPKHAFRIIKSKAQIANPEEVVMHTARHTCASLLVSSGVDVASVQKLLNHKSIESTLRYAKLDATKQRQTTQNLSTLIQDYNPLANAS